MRTRACNFIAETSIVAAWRGFSDKDNRVPGEIALSVTSWG